MRLLQKQTNNFRFQNYLKQIILIVNDIRKSFGYTIDIGYQLKATSKKQWYILNVSDVKSGLDAEYKEIVVEVGLKTMAQQHNKNTF
ncbi:unnamed protein product [Paramecium sonneborni]|uniref:Uncharacterized protein n=1 Tax=Paramecium sonneborni TaxID=65129 RepID=A0A8S1RQR4_9CILI|nr:unnamed protein product [Paramecium sonneborni]